MSLLKPTVYDNNASAERLLSIGDVLCQAQVIPAAVATQPLTLLAPAILAGIVLRSNGANSVDTIDTAANIIAAINSVSGGQAVDVGTTFELTYIQSLAFNSTLTATANTGITVTNPITNASSVKKFLVTIQNGTPARTVAAASGTNASPILTGLTDAEVAALTPGMIVLNAVSGLQGTTIIGVNIAARSVTMSGNANATAIIAPQFSPRVSFYGLGQGLL
jgi:hypothetical protein